MGGILQRKKQRKKQIISLGITRFLLLNIVSISLVVYQMGVHPLFLTEIGEDSLTQQLRHCQNLSDSGLWLPEENFPPHIISSSNRTRQPIDYRNRSSDFRVLCTSLEKRIVWGSYKLRCDDLKRWAVKCAPDVDITVGVSIEQLHERWVAQVGPFYNATIFIKSMSKRDYPQFGKKYIDLVDEYNWNEIKIPPEMHLILQTKWQGQEVYPNHNFSTVEHWYNSYPADMIRSGEYPVYIPPIIQKSSRRLRIASIWNTQRSHDPTEGGCPTLNTPNVKYECLDKDFDISTWYLNIFEGKKDTCEMERILADPKLGAGMLYYNVFRNFDALVVLAKNHTMKLQYGNVQRAVSQMRSGVPVLMEIRGRVFQDFMDQYNYSCAFRRYNDEGTYQYGHNRVSMSFDEAVEHLKNEDVRKECQRQGLEIVKDYSPSKIGQKFLKAVGYEGGFDC